MNASVKSRLETIRADYTEVVGQPFRHFFCPILLTDEQVPLCKAHLVNQAFPKASKRWTIQRADVDNFYGGFFEGDFVHLQHRDKPVEDFINDSSSAKALRPELHMGGAKVEYYRPAGHVPANFSQIVVEGKSGSVRLALKIEPEKMPQSIASDWQIRIEKDCRIAALVSVIKAAHLTLFEMLGYRYALSAGGLFLGRSVLGRFFLENHLFSKNEVINNAENYFDQYANLVRPVLFPENIVRDTVSDRMMYIGEDSCRWAFLVLLRTSKLVHAALVPLLESTDAAARFANFLRANGGIIQARQCRFDGSSFQIARDTQTLVWPEVSLD